MADTFTFRVGDRVVALHTFDAIAADVERDIGVILEWEGRGGSITGTLDQLERFAAILDCTNTLDDCDPAYRRASIKAAERLKAFVVELRQGRCSTCGCTRACHAGSTYRGSCPCGCRRFRLNRYSVPSRKEG